MSKETGGPAFPCELPSGDVAPGANGINRYITDPYPGMTLRDYFAAKAMQGDFAAGEEVSIVCNEGYDGAATQYYKMADAMLEARKT